MDRGSAEAQERSRTEIPADASATQMAPPRAAIDVMQLPSHNGALGQLDIRDLVRWVPPIHLAAREIACGWFSGTRPSRGP